MPTLRYIDIGVNLTDPIFHGLYGGKQAHEDDFINVTSRADAAGVKGMMITGGSLYEAREAVDLANRLGEGVYATAGVHPTRTSQLDAYHSGPAAYLALLDELIEQNSKPKGKGRIVAYGECGLDYDRLHFASAETQRKHFFTQLKMAQTHSLPLFLHSRSAHRDFTSICRGAGYEKDGGRRNGGMGGVVHSFTGTEAEMKELVEMGFYIGLNGCSLKTEENLAVARAVPLDRLMLETDAPWCSITSTHASHSHLKTLPSDLNQLYFPDSCKKEKFVMGKTVKGRNEPCAIGGVAWIIAQAKGVAIEEVAEHAWRNTIKLFDLQELDKSLE
ncbi:Mg-dependent DNase [Dacryopinax primogenitus]|uniref:Mg-dependent DNase n=1 Tax=Dacryopinax primogenitus (strain DJM 731) TaxID=1858805 RepID=M5FUS6_DACPD|nr:Mg-dependent DNase [Dacryopinax primogenitus]EJU00009.1 Mg-dependent DNase [Dacryopinax primogenitus]